MNIFDVVINCKRDELFIVAKAHEIGCLICTALEVYNREINQIKIPNIKLSRKGK